MKILFGPIRETVAAIYRPAVNFLRAQMDCLLRLKFSITARSIDLRGYDACPDVNPRRLRNGIKNP